MDKIFLDTDVIIDFLLDRSPHAKHASKLFDLSDKGEITPWVSALSISNIHYVTRRILGSSKAVEVLKELTALVEIREVGEKQILEALSSDFADFEDAIQHFTACSIGGLQGIITRNTKDFKKSRLLSSLLMNT